MWYAIRHWHSTAEERALSLPCDEHLSMPYRSLHRAVDIDAPVSLVFRWLCQLRVAPYSYTWVHPYAPSPRELTPGAEDLAVGQDLLIGSIVDFEPDRQISAVARPEMARIYGPLSVTYLVRRREGAGSRLLVRLNLGVGSPAAKVREALLAVGDLFMMRKQLLTIKELAERDARRAVSEQSRR